VDDSRFLKLEERIAWLEKHVLEQDKIMLGLADENDRLKKVLLQLRGRLLSGDGEQGEPSFPADERPPHY
jgi:SlyX protein